MLTIPRLKMMWIFTGILLFNACFPLNGSKFESHEIPRRGISNHSIDGVESDFFKDGGSGEASEEMTEIFPNINSQFSAGDRVEYPGSIFTTTPQPEDDQEFAVTVGRVAGNNQDVLHTQTNIHGKKYETEAEMPGVVDTHEKELQDSPARSDAPLKNIEESLKTRNKPAPGTRMSPQRPLKSIEASSRIFFTKGKLWSASKRRPRTFKRQLETTDNEDSDTGVAEDYDDGDNDDDDDDDDDDDVNSIYTLSHFRDELYTYVNEQVAVVNGSVVDMLLALQNKIAQLENRLTENMAYTSVLETKIRVSANPQPGDIRLLSSDSCGRVSRAGYLLFYTGTSWGFVCDDFFNAAAVKVACTQLGYPEPRSALEFGPRRSPSASDTPMNQRWQDSFQIVLDDVQCTGNESTIDSCSHFELGMHDCAMNEVVYLSC